MTVDPISLAMWVKDAGTFAVLCIIIYAGWTGKFVWRWHYDKELSAANERAEEYKQDAQEWKSLSLELLRSNRTSIATGQTLAEIASHTAKEGK